MNSFRYEYPRSDLKGPFTHKYLPVVLDQSTIVKRCYCLCCLCLKTTLTHQDQGTFTRAVHKRGQGHQEEMPTHEDADPRISNRTETLRGYLMLVTAFVGSLVSRYSLQLWVMILRPMTNAKERFWGAIIDRREECSQLTHCLAALPGADPVKHATLTNLSPHEIHQM